jgi:hypothetical protein
MFFYMNSPNNFVLSKPCFRRTQEHFISYIRREKKAYKYEKQIKENTIRLKTNIVTLNKSTRILCVCHLHGANKASSLHQSTIEEHISSAILTLSFFRKYHQIRCTRGFWCFITLDRMMLVFYNDWSKIGEEVVLGQNPDSSERWTSYSSKLQC